MSNPYLEECLKTYEDKLQGAIDMYKSTLDKSVWNSLNKEQQEKFL